MSADSNTITPPLFTKHSYKVLIEHQPEGQVSATVLEWQDCKVKGATKEEALNKLCHLLTNRLQNTQILHQKLSRAKTRFLSPETLIVSLVN